ncbi:MAG TPA: hypothetical protein VHI13_11530 [Candidatus Kapabacteria bacterium]|nr:hypothetical protein [Candidatus Kapabacteria bacterium]
MRRAFTILALFTFAIYADGIVAIWSCYYAASDAIAAAHCVNRSNPCCHGKCYVSRLACNTQTGSAPSSAASTLKLSPYVLQSGEEIPAPAPAPVAHCDAAADTHAGAPPAIDHPPPFPA